MKRKKIVFAIVLSLLLSGMVVVGGDGRAGTEGEGEREVHHGSSRDLAEEDMRTSQHKGLEGLDLILEPSIPGRNSTHIERTDGGSYSIVTDDSDVGKGEVGKPEVPVFRDWILIPQGTSPQLEVNLGGTITYENIEIPPVQPSPVDHPNDSEGEFIKETDIYEKDADYPGTFAEIGSLGSLRGQDVAIIEIYPYQYNPIQEKLFVYPDLTVDIDFVGELQSTPSRFKGTSFETMTRRLAVNADQVLKAQEKVVERREDSETDIQAEDMLFSLDGEDHGAEYLIITAPKFESEAKELRDWRTQMGIPARVATTEETGDTADEITSYIEDAYEDWNPSPEYLLLFGDAEYIPPHYETEHPTRDVMVGTDIYYAATEDSDCEYFPDLSHGRIAVETEAQAQSRVDEIIKYEREPVTSTSFYETTTHAAQFDDSEDDGYAERRFTQTSEDIAIFLEDDEYLGEYSAERIYEYTSGAWLFPNGPEYWRESSYFDGGPAGDGGDPIPEHLSDDWDGDKEMWDGDADDISSAVEDGTFLLTHRNHGGTWGWGTPRYYYSDVEDLNNGEKLPVVWSMNCLTGYFDHETCEEASHSMSFVEAWERNQDGGAAGVIASTRVSYSNHNDRLTWGFTDAIWPEFLDYSGDHGDSEDPPLYRMGDVLNYGKYYYATHFSDYTTRQATFEMFHWFGDPAMQIRTDVPEEMTVDHPPEVLAGESQEVTVTVEDQRGSATEDARVALYKESEIYEVGSTDSRGEVTFQLEPKTEGTIGITTSKQNFIPSEDTIEVTEPEYLEVSIEGEGRVEVDGEEVSDGWVGPFLEDAEVELTAGSEQHWYFVEWTGDASGSEEEIKITMDDDKEVTAWFEEHSYTLDVMVEGEGEVEIEPEKREYDPEEEVELKAVPEEHWYFDIWTGDASGSEEEIKITMDDDKEIIAWFEEHSYTLDVVVEGEGEVEIEPEKREYDPGEEVELRAVPEEHWYFDIWVGDISRTEEEITIKMDGDKEIIAWFEEQSYTLDVMVEGKGEVEMEPEKREYDPEEEVELRAVPGEHWYFVEWAGSREGTDENITIKMDGDKEIIAWFEEHSYTLDVVVEGEGEVEMEPDKREYDPEEEVELRAVPGEHWYFVEWAGSHEATDENITIKMDDDKEIIAWFEEHSYTLDVVVEGEGDVEMEPDKVEYDPEEEVELRAVPGEHWYFVEWTGSYEGTDGNMTMMMNEDKEITAHFEEDTYSLKLNVEGGGSIEIEPDRDVYEPGTEVSLTAMPDKGWYFVEWTGSHEATDEVITITADGDKELTALFERYETSVFEVEVTGYDKTVREGEQIRVEYAVTNTGKAETTQDILVSMDSEEYVVHEGLTLSPREEYTGNFSLMPEKAGEYDVELFGDDARDVVRVTVEEEVEPPSDGSDEDEEPGHSSFLFDYWWIFLILVIAAILLISEMWRKKGKKKVGTCPDCGGELKYIEEHDRWYCNFCHKYR